jgi:peptidoglycan/xylan/chitin deacetylase (PgdA/CDA1 family)
LAASFAAALSWRRITLVTLALIATAGASAGAAQAQTIVSITFDDGAQSQYDNARPALAEHGVHATFYINSGFVNPRADGSTNSYFMSWAELQALAAAGQEIAGHTLMDKSLTTEITSPEERTEAICGDRQNLIDHGLTPISFAYPHGNFNAEVQSIVHQCGYASARLVGGLYDSDCFRCPVAESIPPRDPYAVGSNSAASGQLTADILEGYVTRAADGGGGWVPLNIHDVCYPGTDPGDCPANSVNGSIKPSEFDSFLDWLRDHAPSGTVVKTVGEVVPTRPPAILPHVIRPFGAPAKDKVTAFASLKVRKVQDVDNIRVAASMLEPGRLSATGTVKVGNASRIFKLKRAAKPASPGKRVKLRLKLSKKGLRAAKRAIRAHTRVRARITITATDKPGNRTRAKRTIRLRD